MTRLLVVCSLFLVAVSTGCSAEGNERSMRILYNRVPDVDNGTCVLNATDVAAFYPSGSVDTTSTTGYFATPLISSLLEGSTRNVAVNGFNIDITLPEGLLTEDQLKANDAYLHYSYPVTGFLEAGGLLHLYVLAIPPEILEVLDGIVTPDNDITVFVEMTAYGTMAAGEIFSIPFTYPVSVCKDCLYIDLGPCGNLVNYTAPLVCIPGQDTVTACCTDDQMNNLCPAPSNE